MSTERSAPALSPPPVDEALVSQAVLDQGTVLRALHDAGVPPWLELDLTIGQLRALYALFRSGPLPIGQLGAALGLGKPAASLLVDALVQRGLVERNEDPQDRRRTFARLSPATRDQLGAQRSGGRELLAGWLRRLPPEDLAHLARGLRALAAQAAAAGCPPPDRSPSEAHRA